MWGPGAGVLSPRHNGYKRHPMSTTTRGRIQDALNILCDLAKLRVEP
jgi:hypothetical protein